MNGVLLIDKPAGLTSHDVVYKLRRKLKIKRIGHTGTLDPFATGLMVMLVGKATRLAQFLDKDEKEYVALIKFGAETDTGDRTGQFTRSSELSDKVLSQKLIDTDWLSVFSQFTGNIMQTPPMYSAKKIGGKKLYELAREGKEIERKPVPVTISNIDIVSLNPEDLTLHIAVKCSAGTYIRTLAEDIGRAVGCPAHLQELRRTAAGKFDLENAQPLTEIEDMPASSVDFITMDNAVDHLPVLDLPAERVSKTLNGLSTRLYDKEFNDGQNIRMNSDGKLLAIGIYNAAERSVRPNLVLA